MAPDNARFVRIRGAMSESTITLATLLQRRERTGDNVRFHVSEDWLQGRTTFGGLISVLGVQSMRDVAGSGWGPEVALRALQTSFIGPVEQGPVDVAVRVLREGKSVRQIQSTLTQNGQTAAMFVGVFAVDRDSSIPRHAPVYAPTRAPETIARTSPTIGTRPSFTRHFDMRWAEGSPPGSGVAEWDARIHLQLLDTDAATLSPELLAVMMADVSPSPASTHLTKPASASSISWALELQPIAADEAIAGWWRTDNHVAAARGGYVNVQSTLWTPGGALAALAYQVAAVYG